MQDDVLARVEASGARRIIGLGLLLSLGGLLIYVALAAPPQNFAWQLFLLSLGAAALWAADRMRRATLKAVELTEEVLRDSEGVILAHVADMVSVDRGPFAFKPSNGFTLRLTRKQGRSWQPGLWWRFGRRVGVGGVTPGRQTRLMSDIIAGMISQRDNPVDDL